MDGTTCWICRRDVEELKNSFPPDFLDTEKNLFWNYNIIGKAIKFPDQQIVEKEIKKLKQMTVKDLDKLWVKIFGEDGSVPLFEQGNDNFVYGKSSWEELAEGLHGLKTMEILDDEEGPAAVYYQQKKIEIVLCRVCDAITTWSYCC